MDKPYTLHLGDCIAVMKTMSDNSVDSVVCDPPYGIRFMGKSWDGADIEARTRRRRSFPSHAPDAGPNGGHKSIAAEAGKYDLAPAAMLAFQEFSEEWAREAFRILKPGGHLLSFSSGRTYHRMTCGIEDAGFIVRDQALWLYGSGFPKSRDLAKMDFADTADADAWSGWGTALKPAHEPICMARKPLAKGLTVGANVLVHGTGAINIDACRVHGDDSLGGTYTVKRLKPGATLNETGGNWRPDGQDVTLFHGEMKPGRWPANIIHDGSPEVVALFPAQAGQQAALKTRNSDKTRNVLGSFAGTEDANFVPHDERGSAARFFYCAKASRSDRNEGLLDPGPVHKHGATLRHMENAVRDGSATGNTHPTVKPTDLMAYLCRLVTPPGGVILDPFMGSGSTGKAAMREGFQFIGIDQDADYLAIATARIEHEFARVSEAAALAAVLEPQLDLFTANEAERNNEENVA